MTRMLIATAAALATFATAGAALAGEAPAGRQTTVRYADLDLTTAAGQAKLDQRIDRAARAACSSQVDSRIARVDAACFAHAKASTEREMAAVRAVPRGG